MSTLEIGLAISVVLGLILGAFLAGLSWRGQRNREVEILRMQITALNIRLEEKKEALDYVDRHAQAKIRALQAEIDTLKIYHIMKDQFSDLVSD